MENKFVSHITETLRDNPQRVLLAATGIVSSVLGFSAIPAQRVEASSFFAPEAQIQPASPMFVLDPRGLLDYDGGVTLNWADNNGNEVQSTMSGLWKNDPQSGPYLELPANSVLGEANGVCLTGEPSTNNDGSILVVDPNHTIEQQQGAVITWTKKDGTSITSGMSLNWNNTKDVSLASIPAGKNNLLGNATKICVGDTTQDNQ
ncbi:MAG: hypothetical protein NUV52_03120 [Candidatus Roizmanbacteria bacterium]|nr:hypothetical protein [Candidatus Roizmanbacteria bacterium]